MQGGQKGQGGADGVSRDRAEASKVVKRLMDGALVSTLATLSKDLYWYDHFTLRTACAIVSYDMVIVSLYFGHGLCARP